ncbi:MAG: VCBS repeat-containing protein [Verrucomicrobia bacterium]|nr:VCBS repeat-containing protein [Verrucomicrobiota bacterium]MCH8527113.1 VCBS repeat-containing protein [Kiritimatiellia bacterium]
MKKFFTALSVFIRVHPRLNFPAHLKNPLTAAALALCVFSPPVRALINPNFTPVQLIGQSTAIWEAALTLDEEAFTITAVTTDTLKGDALAQNAVLDFSDNDWLLFDLQEAFTDNTAKGIFITGDFSGAAMDGGEVDEQPWAMLKVGTQWIMIASGEDKPFVIREDPIDLSTVWAGDPVNLRQVIDYILTDPRAAVPVASGGRWASEEKLFDLDGTVLGLESVTLGDKPLVMVYRAEGDQILDPAKEFEDITDTLELASASVHAAWGRFFVSSHPSLASITPSGELVFWRRSEKTFKAVPTGQTFENVTGIAAVAGPETAMLLIGTAEGTVLGHLRDQEWHTLMTAEIHPEAGIGGPVLAIDLNGDGKPEQIQAGANGLHLLEIPVGNLPLTTAASTEIVNRFIPYSAPVGTPLSLTPADLSGNGFLDLLIGGERGAALVLNGGNHTFREALKSTGELAYNIRPGIHHVGVGDHALDGRVDLVLFNQQLPPQIYFNRGFAVFGYDMELDLIEGAPDAQDAAGRGQQAGLLADLTGNGLQELLMITHDGEVWLLTRDAEATTPLGAALTAPPALSGPVPVVIRDGNRVLGARILSPGAPAQIGRRNRGPVTLSWRLPGETADREQRLILLRQENHVLSVD